MKAVFLVVFVLLLFLFSPSSAYGQKIPNAIRDVVKTFQREQNTENKIRVERQEEMLKARAQFKEKLKNLRDERKKNLTERIDAKIANSSQKHTARFGAVLAKLSKILERISRKASEAKAKGADTTRLEEAIALAQNSIDSARAAVDQQKAKTYIIQIPENEQGIKAAVGIVVSQFRGELKDVYKKVVEAKQTVMKAEMELAKVK